MKAIARAICATLGYLVSIVSGLAVLIMEICIEQPLTPLRLTKARERATASPQPIEVPWKRAKAREGAGGDEESAGALSLATVSRCRARKPRCRGPLKEAPFRAFLTAGTPRLGGFEGAARRLAGPKPNRARAGTWLERSSARREARSWP